MINAFSKWSFTEYVPACRYNDIYKMFSQYETDGIKIGPQEAVTVCATVGEKGDGTDEATCDPDLYLEVPTASSSPTLLLTI